ncbi:hypothetical protein [Brevibacterium spongiae]|uniref:GNAT family N-acetyltransferase n=1 Tax=Brevibacterium spongiae TaxID=2909672 RepID=A0ABY5SRP6_9MICO|nr:hypothetical protein [Brevibacterium spongiae]UVI37228.1 hypothetical protein L1F31_06140 [Brevibacterium spongiae]
MRPRRVGSRAELTEFIELAPRLARRRGEDEHYVPLFASDIRQWFTGRGWFDQPVELWLFDDAAGRTAARVMCHRSPALAKRLGDTRDGPPPLFFGALEASDATALETVIDFLIERAERLEAPRIFGPVSPLPNVTGGLLTDADPSPGFFDTAWNPGFHWPAFAAAGFAPWGPAHTWEVPVGTIPAARATAVTDAEWHRHGLRRRRVSRFGLRGFADRLLPTLNAAFADLPYYTQISAEQLRAQMQGLSALMDPDLIIDIVGADDPDDAPPRCFVLVIPDPAPVLRRHGGRLGPAAITELLLTRPRLRDAVLIIQGTDPVHQGSGLLSLAIRALNSALIAGSYRRLRVTFIAEDNPASAAVFERSGGRRLHRLIFVDRGMPIAAQPTEEAR